jgi:hypothetical protein
MGRLTKEPDGTVARWQASVAQEGSTSTLRRQRRPALYRPRGGVLGRHSQNEVVSTAVRPFAPPRYK